MKSFIGAVLFICVAFSANAQLLWKVSGNGLNQPSYIIGTHHLAPFSIMDSIAGLQKAMKETQQVYGELKNVGNAVTGHHAENATGYDDRQRQYAVHPPLP